MCRGVRDRRANPIALVVRCCDLVVRGQGWFALGFALGLMASACRSTVEVGETRVVEDVRAEPTARIEPPRAEIEPADDSAPAQPELGPPPPLPEGDAVTVGDLVVALEAVAVSLESRPALAADYDAWRTQHGLPASDRLWRDYVRVRLVFECVRDGGLWRLRWAITNEEPRSDLIWAHWSTLDEFDAATESATATAECDELSALFAHLVRRLGVQDVGLFWPTWNHVVAVWTVQGEAAPVRIVVPTSQIFLDSDASLGTDGFNPSKQKKIYEYRRKDVRDDARIPAALARFFVESAWTQAGRPQAELQAERNARSARLGGS
jgi:hypothetical protein